MQKYSSIGMQVFRNNRLLFAVTCGSSFDRNAEMARSLAQLLNGAEGMLQDAEQARKIIEELREHVDNARILLDALNAELCTVEKELEEVKSERDTYKESYLRVLDELSAERMRSSIGVN